MKDLKDRLEKLLTDADDCELIGRLATDPNKRETFRKLAVDLRAIARDVQAVISTQQPQAVSHKIEDGRMVPRASE
jgi:hypothetical protein